MYGTGAASISGAMLRCTIHQCLVDGVSDNPSARRLRSVPQANLSAASCWGVLLANPNHDRAIDELGRATRTAQGRERLVDDSFVGRLAGKRVWDWHVGSVEEMGGRSCHPYVVLDLVYRRLHRGNLHDVGNVVLAVVAHPNGSRFPGLVKRFERFPLCLAHRFAANTTPAGRKVGQHQVDVRNLELRQRLVECCSSIVLSTQKREREGGREGGMEGETEREAMS